MLPSGFERVIFGCQLIVRWQCLGSDVVGIDVVEFDDAETHTLPIRNELRNPLIEIAHTVGIT
jgi:hypothetical protein